MKTLVKPLLAALLRAVAGLLLMAWAPLAFSQAERLALVVGNSSYPGAPLTNPKNDAKAMADLLRQAGFTVDQQMDTSQAQLTQAVARFGQAIKDPKVKFGLFYYAGHGLQQDWRNYLVPVSADIRTAEDVRKQTVDVSALLTYMEQAKGRNFLVILDACRDDPFAGGFKPSAAGLSQFDAPAGSLLAYATAPGKVAQDGIGANGLYTGNLLREFAVKGVRLEDAFKRVRLSVRIASNGQQVPWESTSLEEDVYLFPFERKKLSEAEQDQLLEQELLSWQKVRASSDITQLVNFIREYPSGSASELAQSRLSRLLNAQAVKEANQQQVVAANAMQQQIIRDSQESAQAARLQAEKAEAQRLAAERAEAARQQAQAAELARQEAARAEAARLAEQQAQAARLAEQQLKEAQALAARREAERLAAAQAQEQARLAVLAEQQQAAQREAQRLAQVREQERAQEQQRLAVLAEQAAVAAQVQAEQARAAAERVVREQTARQDALAKEQALAQARAQAAAEEKARQQAQVQAERLAQAQAAERAATAAAQAKEQAAAAAAQKALQERQAQAAQEAEKAQAARQEAQRQAQLQAEAVAAAQAREREAALQAQRAEQQRQAQAAAEAEKARVAQAELARLTAEKERAAQTLAALQSKPQPTSQPTAQPPVAQTLAATPYFKGYQEHQRSYQTGDFFNYQVIDVYTKASKPLNLQVTAVNMEADRVEYNGGEYVSDTMGNTTTNPRGGFSTPRQFYPAELFVGKKWQSAFKQARPNGITYTFRYDMKVVARETITVPAGTFDTFKIEARGFNLQLGARLERNIWVAPGVSGDIAHEIFVRLSNGAVEQNDRQELVTFRQAGPRTAGR